MRDLDFSPAIPGAVSTTFDQSNPDIIDYLHKAKLPSLPLPHVYQSILGKISSSSSSMLRAISMIFSLLNSSIQQLTFIFLSIMLESFLNTVYPSLCSCF